MTRQLRGPDRILVLSVLAIKRAGNQSLFNMLSGAAEGGFEVHYAQFRSDSPPPSAYQLPPGVIVHEVRTMPRWIRRIWLLVRDRVLLRESANTASVEKQSASDAGTPRDYVPAAPESAFLSSVGKLSWAWTQVCAFVWGVLFCLRYRPRLVYGYEFGASLAASFAGRVTRRPVVTRFQGTFLFPVLHRPEARSRFWEHIQATRAPADLVIMTDDGTRGADVLKALGVPGDRIRFWRNGVDFSVREKLPSRSEARAALGVPDSAPVLLTISKLAFWKRVDRAVHALAGVVPNHPAARLFVVGGGPDQRRLEELAECLGVRAKVTFVGPIPHYEVMRYLAACDVFLSLYDLSNLSNPVLESMVCERAIVSIADGSLDALLEDGHSAVLVPYEQLHAELPAVVNRLLSNQPERERLAAGARRAAEERLWSVEERRAAEVEALHQLVAPLRV